MENRNTFSWLKEKMIRSISMSIMIYVITRICISNAYPIFVQQGYEDLGEATERIVLYGPIYPQANDTVNDFAWDPRLLEKYIKIFP